jgi:perosamine synthetase
MAVELDDRYRPPACGELEEFAGVLANGGLSGGAPVVAAYERTLAAWFGVARAIAVSSGTSALHATLAALGAKAGTEVLVPATAPLPTAMPILTCGATPVIVDTRPGSLALDPADLVRKLTSRSRAAILLPLWGYPNDDGDALAVLADAGVPALVDACQAHGTLVDGRHAGTVAAAGCYSTHDRKLLATGEGGFVLTDSLELAERIDFHTHLGHLQGTYGVNYKLAAPLAAIGLTRLGRLSAQLDARRRNARRILDQLPPDGTLRELAVCDSNRPNYYTLVLTMTRPDERHHRELAAAFASAGLPPDSVRYGYRPLHRQRLFADDTARCPNAERLATSTVQLPVHPGMAPDTIEWIAARVADFARPGAIT